MKEFRIKNAEMQKCRNAGMQECRNGGWRMEDGEWGIS
jgi:hypothetical protein